MDKLEKIEIIREKCGVSYEEARDALDANNGDVLDAIVALEREGKVKAPHSASYSTYSDSSGSVSPEMVLAQSEYRENSKKNPFSEVWEKFVKAVKQLFNSSLKMTFEVNRKGEHLFDVPFIVLIIGLFIWGATIWLLLLGLFFGFRYHIKGASPITIDVNNIMDKAADVAEDLTNSDDENKN